MANRTFHSSPVTFIDRTDERTLDVYITSNLPTTQIYNSNTKVYTPNWIDTNLQLTPSIFVESKDITSDIQTSIVWYKQVGSETRTQVSSNKVLTISTNELSVGAGIITYICEATYQGISSHNQVVFTRVDSGLNGTNGTPAPTVLAQYSINGTSDWTSTLNASAHKYIRYSYDGGKTWTATIKIKGEDGTSIILKGTAYTSDTLIPGSTVTLYTDSAYTIPIDTTILTTGDSYLVDEYLCVYNAESVSFICIGKIRGPQGNDGVSSYVFIRYATDANGSNMSTNPSGKTYIGINTSTTNIAPTTASSYTWSKFVGEVKSVILNGDSQVFKVSKNNTISPSIITVTAQALNTSVTTWLYSTDGGQTFVSTVPTGVSRNSNTVTLTGTDIASNTLVIKASDGTYSDTYTIYKVYDGTDGAKGDIGQSASMAFLTNENITFSADASGKIIGTSTSFSTNVVSYSGTTKVTPMVGTVTGLPEGMSVNTSTAVVNNERTIIFSFSTNATLGSTTSNSGTITIPITSPVSTNLKLNWSKINTGTSGRGVRTVTEYYAVNNSKTVAPTSWSTAIPIMDVNNQYLWNYEEITYTDNDKESTQPIIIGIYSGDGRGISSIVNYYLAVGATSDITRNTAGWTTTPQTMSSTNKYLWNYEAINYTKGDPDYTEPTIIGVYGDKGDIGTPASLVKINPSALYFKSTTGKDGVFSPQYIYLYPRFQNSTYSSWQYSLTGGTSWLSALGANGLTIGSYSSVANTLRVASNSTLFTDDVTSITFRCNTTNGMVYDTVSVAKIYDVVDLVVGGRNLARYTNSEYWSNYVTSTVTFSEGTRSKRIKAICNATDTSTSARFGIQQSMPARIMKLQANQEYTLSFLVRGNISNLNYTYLMNSGSTNQHIGSIDLSAISETNFTRVSRTFTASAAADVSTGSYLMFAYAGAKDTTMWFELEEVQLELGNTSTDWTLAPEDTLVTTFQLYAPKGYLLTSDIPEVTLQTFAYEGSREITEGTFKWYKWNNEAWEIINGAISSSLNIRKSDVLKSSTYKCEMTYKGTVYTATETIEDKTDIYESLIRVNVKRSSNNIYWILYAVLYSEEGERDSLLGPISEAAPTNPVTGSYWYQINPTDYSVTLKKYSGTAWANTTDKQELTYDWLLIRDTTDIMSIGNRGKVVIVKSGDFSQMCNMQCNIFDADNTLLSRNNQVLNDPSDPVVSEVAPNNPIDGQIWIKVGTDNTYILSVWNASNNQWVVSNADSRNKIYVSKPTQYSAGDIWIVGGDYRPTVYLNGVVQSTKHLEKTMLRATATSQTYSDAHWVEALNYNEQLDKISNEVGQLTQFFSFDDTGMTMQAKTSSGQISEFKTKLTNTELGFYQGEDEVAYINNNQLNISKAEITNGLIISGTSPQMQLGGFIFIQESNGSLSIG